MLGVRLAPADNSVHGGALIMPRIARSRSSVLAALGFVPRRSRPPPPPRTPRRGGDARDSTRPSAAIGARLCRPRATPISDAVAHLEWRPSGRDRLAARRGPGAHRQPAAGPAACCGCPTTALGRAARRHRGPGRRRRARTGSARARGATPSDRRRARCSGWSTQRLRRQRRHVGGPAGDAAGRGRPRERRRRDPRATGHLLPDACAARAPAPPAARIRVVADEPRRRARRLRPGAAARGRLARRRRRRLRASPTRAPRAWSAPTALQRLYRQTSARRACGPAPTASPRAGPSRAAGSHVRLEDGSSPGGSHACTSPASTTWRVQHRGLALAGRAASEVRHYGTTAAARGHRTLRAASDCVDRAATTCHTMRRPTASWLRRRRRRLPRRAQPRAATRAWAAGRGTACKSHDEEITGHLLNARAAAATRSAATPARGHGSTAWTPTTGRPDENMRRRRSTTCGNLVTGCGDDAIETDTISGINTRASGTTVFDGNYGGMLGGAHHPGPDVHPLQHHHRLPPRRVRVLAVERRPALDLPQPTTWSGATYTAAVWRMSAYSNVHFRDNILTGNGLPCVNDETGECADRQRLRRRPAVRHGQLRRCSSWKSVRYANLAARARRHRLRGLHGASGDPLFVSPATGDFGLQAGEPRRRRGHRGCPAWTTASPAPRPTSAAAGSAARTAWSPSRWRWRRPRRL
ncbi:MAG: hypothetical protein MZV63_33430 [Marinilabiliales bacterium]|nr:hypothetical protein [Marinilabiliales bacterium]